MTAKPCPAQTLQLDRTRSRIARPAKLVPFEAWLERNFKHRQPSAKRTALLNQCGCPSLRVGRSEAFIVTIWQDSEDRSRIEY